MEKLMEKAVERYNSIMFSICREYNTIGTRYTEDAENRNNWNLRDLVSEMQYTLDIYEDESCVYWEEAHEPHQPRYKSPKGDWYMEWVNIKNRMKRFIHTYSKYIADMECEEGHSSMYD